MSLQCRVDPVPGDTALVERGHWQIDVPTHPAGGNSFASRGRDPVDARARLPTGMARHLTSFVTEAIDAVGNIAVDLWTRVNG